MFSIRPLLRPCCQRICYCRETYAKAALTLPSNKKQEKEYLKRLKRIEGLYDKCFDQKGKRK